jgi:hypothetical protein
VDRDTAVNMAQQAIKTKNKRLVDAVLKIKAECEQNPQPQKPMSEWPLIAAISTGQRNTLYGCHCVAKMF